MSYVDAHCHLADPRIGNDVSRLIEEAGLKGITCFVQGGVSPEDWDRQLRLKEKFPGKIITSFGVHPWWVADHSTTEVEQALAILESRVSQADALGELGLDRSQKVPADSFEQQMTAFEFQLELANRLHKPIVLHVVRAHEEALSRLEKDSLSGQGLSGLVHSFSASREIAKRYLDLGLTLSISGVVTRDGYETLKRAVSYIPQDRLVIETDAPDQSPRDWDRPFNEPVALFQVAQAIADLRGVESQTILEVSAENIRRMFSL
jgi:TatD DNase family protein